MACSVHLTACQPARDGSTHCSSSSCPTSACRSDRSSATNATSTTTAAVAAVVVVVDVDDVNDDTPAPAAADVLCSTDNDRLIREGVE